MIELITQWAELISKIGHASWLVLQPYFTNIVSIQWGFLTNWVVWVLLGVAFNNALCIGFGLYFGKSQEERSASVIVRVVAIVVGVGLLGVAALAFLPLIAVGLGFLLICLVLILVTLSPVLAVGFTVLVLRNLFENIRYRTRPLLRQWKRSLMGRRQPAVRQEPVIQSRRRVPDPLARVETARVAPSIRSEPVLDKRWEVHDRSGYSAPADPEHTGLFPRVRPEPTGSPEGSDRNIDAGPVRRERVFERGNPDEPPATADDSPWTTFNPEPPAAEPRPDASQPPTSRRSPNLPSWLED